MKLIIASNNKHKLEEIRAILGNHFAEIQSLAEAGIDHETVEDGETFMENAVKKAREIAEISGCCALADDSGLCVDALDGGPGIYSARFSGVHGDDEANNDLLLRRMEGMRRPRAVKASSVAIVGTEDLIVRDGDCSGGEWNERHGYHAKRLPDGSVEVYPRDGLDAVRFLVTDLAFDEGVPLRVSVRVRLPETGGRTLGG